MLEEILHRVKLRDFVIVTIASLAIIAIWRGVWNLLDAYFIRDNFFVSQVVSVAVGMLLLIILVVYKKKNKIK